MAINLFRVHHFLAIAIMEKIVSIYIEFDYFVRVFSLQNSNSKIVNND